LEIEGQLCLTISLSTSSLGGLYLTEAAATKMLEYLGIVWYPYPINKIENYYDTLKLTDDIHVGCPN
jgi:hypothetical protein